MSRVLLRRAIRCLVATVAGLVCLCSAGPVLGQAAARGCTYAGSSVWRASAPQLRLAVVCLINHVRARRGLPGVIEQGQLDAAAQGHSNAMVAEDFFGHGDPASRISAAGFTWGAYGEAISTGYGTPWGVVEGWLSSAYHCQILLSPTYRFVGVGVDQRGVAGWTGLSGTWTADFALPLGWNPPSGDWGPASGCPY
jgi:uncharacterized protein YkwD